MKLNDVIKEWAPLVGRFILALIFLTSGLGKIGGFEGTAAYMTSKGIPLANIALVLTIIIEVGGAAMIILGFKARIGAAALFLWMIPVNIMMHNFWAVPEAAKPVQMIMFMKNLSMMGAMLLIMAFGSGPKSLRAN